MSTATETKTERPDYGQHPELIEVGMGVTLRTGLGGLYIPYTVIEVRRKGKELVIQRDNSHFPPGYNWAGDTSGVTYTPNPDGKTETITLRNDGTFIEKGCPKEWYATRYHVGFRRDWTDYSQ